MGVTDEVLREKGERKKEKTKRKRKRKKESSVECSGVWRKWLGKKEEKRKKKEKKRVRVHV